MSLISGAPGRPTMNGAVADAGPAPSAFVARTVHVYVLPAVSALTVSFAKPTSNGGCPITGYTAACYSSNGGATRTHAGTTSSLKVTQLTNGKKYTCRVSARNAKGSGTSSAASAGLTPHAESAPDHDHNQGVSLG